jgi:hypothetical protein
LPALKGLVAMSEDSLETRVRGLEIHVEGPPGELGMRAKIEILWRSYVAGWTLVGTVVGALLTLLVTRFIG